MQVATENCGNPELVREPLRLQPISTFTLKHGIKLIVLGKENGGLQIGMHQIG